MKVKCYSLQTSPSLLPIRYLYIMLTFFRRIRKGLLGDGAAFKYLIYAIGEIALVDIEILSALEINNANEWRKDREMEKAVLIDLKNNITQHINPIKIGFQKNFGKKSQNLTQMNNQWTIIKK